MKPLSVNLADLDAHTKNLFEVYRIGVWHLPYTIGRASGGLALTADRLYAVPLCVHRDITISHLAVEVTALAGGTSVRVGLYNNDGVNFTAAGATLLNNGGTASSAANGIKSIAVAQVLTKGYYWLACISDGTPSIRYHRVAGHVLGIGASGALFDEADGMWFVADTYGNLPDPFPAAPTIIDAALAITFKVASND